MQFGCSVRELRRLNQRRDLLVTIASSSRFVVVDRRHANELLTISHPAVAEHEREAISERTRRAKRPPSHSQA